MYTKCSEQTVASMYAHNMAKKRKRRQEIAADEARCKTPFEEDITRGPSLFRNIVEHAQKLERDIRELKQGMGEDEYGDHFARTLAMLTKLSLQGSYVRYNDELHSLQASREKQHAPFAREKVTGVTRTALENGEIRFGSLLKATNTDQMKLECIARGIPILLDGKQMGWKQMKDAIQSQIRTEWITANPGKVPSETLKQSFAPQSDTEFILKE